jgi:hypothetical protein
MLIKVHILMGTILIHQSMKLVTYVYTQKQFGTNGHSTCAAVVSGGASRSSKPRQKTTWLLWCNFSKQIQLITNIGLLKHMLSC